MSTLPTFASYDGHFITPRLVIGAWPRPEHVDEIAAAGVRGIVNLVALCRRDAMAYVHHLPEHVHWMHVAMWDGFLAEGASCTETLTEGYARLLVQQAAIVMRDHSPVLVHCMGGQGRAGNVGAILLAASEGLTPDEASAKIRARRPSIAPFFHDGFWRHAGGDALVALARQVLDEPTTPPALLCQRVRGEVGTA
ncbi:MAG: dual specificity protein phosphatase [Phycisphaeraceae bacterium]